VIAESLPAIQLEERCDDQRDANQEFADLDRVSQNDPWGMTTLLSTLRYQEGAPGDLPRSSPGESRREVAGDDLSSGPTSPLVTNCELDDEQSDKRQASLSVHVTAPVAISVMERLSSPAMKTP